VEFFKKTAFFQGKTEIDQLELIFKICGTPDEVSWPEMKQLPWTGLFKFQDYPRVLENDLRQTEMQVTEGLVGLVSWILTCNPALRPTASQVLDHPFFKTERPLASLPEQYVIVLILGIIFSHK
jgi:serine/threonine protein kinase